MMNGLLNFLLNYYLWLLSGIVLIVLLRKVFRKNAFSRQASPSNEKPLVVRQAPITGTDVEALRAAVGWDRMAGRYDAILERSYTHFSIIDDDRLIGFINVLSDGIGDAFLVDVLVHPAFHGQGIGHRLVRHVIEVLISEGILCIQVIYDEKQEPFYSKCGFKSTRAGVIYNT